MMQNKKYYAKKLADYFSIDLNSDDLRISPLHGGYVQKLKKIFEKNIDHAIFNDVGDNKLSSNILDAEYKRGTSNTFHYIHNALIFFGILKMEKYNENNMINYGWDLPDVKKYKTFDDYLINTNNEILRSDRNKIFTSILVFLYGETTDFYSINKNLKNIQNKEMKYYMKKGKHSTYFKLILSRYLDFFDSIYLMVFKEKNPFHGDRNAIKIYKDNLGSNYSSLPNIKRKNKSSEIIKNNKMELDRLSTYLNEYASVDNFEKTRTVKYNKAVAPLRKIHRDDIKNELKWFKKAINIIDDYATTFNLKQRIGNVQEAAHIISVEDLLKEKRYEDIGNKDNGLLLDPTTHRMFDKGMLVFSKDNRRLIPSSSESFEYEFTIEKEFLNSERLKFINEWKEKHKHNN